MNNLDIDTNVTLNNERKGLEMQILANDGSHSDGSPSITTSINITNAEVNIEEIKRNYPVESDTIGEHKKPGVFYYHLFETLQHVIIIVLYLVGIFWVAFCVL